MSALAEGVKIRLIDSILNKSVEIIVSLPKTFLSTPIDEPEREILTGTEFETIKKNSSFAQTSCGGDDF